MYFVSGFTYIYKEKFTLFLEAYMKMNCLCTTRDRTSQHTGAFIVSHVVLDVIDMCVWAQPYLYFVSKNCLTIARKVNNRQITGGSQVKAGQDIGC